MVKISTRTYIIKKACSYNRNRTQNQLVLSQESKQRRKKIGILTVMFLMQYFCLHAILPFSKSNYETEGTCSTAKCRGRKSFDTWYHVVTCATLCPSFFTKIGSNSCFSKTYSEIESTWPINWSKQEIVLYRDSKELFVQRFVKVFDQNRKHVEVWNQRTGTQLTLLYRSRTVRSSHRRYCIRKLFLKILQYLQEAPVLESIFEKVADL